MTTSMQAALLRDYQTDFSIETVTLDDPRPDEVLVRIVAVGLCHSDISVQDGTSPIHPMPIVLGHEGAGVVEKVGSEIHGFAVGDRVAISYWTCGDCDNCRAGRAAYCFNGALGAIGGARPDGTHTIHDESGEPVNGRFFGQSSFATHVLTHERNLVHVPDEIPLELVGPLGCGIQTGAGTTLNSLAVPAGATVVVAGAGSVGLSAILGAVVAGATTIIAVDVLESRLEKAGELGATHTINGKDEDVRERLLEISGGGVEYAVDTTAVPAVLTSILLATRPGARVAAVGVGKPEAVIPMGLLFGRTIIGAQEGDATPQLFIPTMMDLYRAGRFPFDKLVTTYRFDQINEAIADTKSGAAVKAVLVM